MKTQRLPRRFLRCLVKGFVVVLPILGTLAIGSWLFVLFESILGASLKWGLGTGGPEAEGPWRYVRYYTGMGTLLSLVIIFFVGLFIDVWWVKIVWNWMEALLDRLPLVKSIYGSSREDFTDLPDGFVGEGVVAVYLPFSYSMSGFTILVRRTDVRRLDMTVEEAMRFAITAGLAVKEREPAQMKGA
jgi:uncharacterized membrane protein